ncbi:hypothetical protein, partial [Vibrio cholerae]|uniref:hypothetical protein n=1 Tax=Vibrio cholerae TaxID=666 RepID=UPI001E554A89
IFVKEYLLAHLHQLPNFEFLSIMTYFLLCPNARLRGWQRITTKLKHNNSNYRGSLGLETPRVDSPS